MTEFDTLVALSFMGSIMLLVVVGLRRVGILGRRSERSVSSGVAAWLADLNNVLMPNQANVEALAKLHEEGEEEQDEGEGEPKQPAAVNREPREGDTNPLASAGAPS